jgi:hypothetical protein
MNQAEAIAAVEVRAFQARLTIAELCAEAGVHHSVWSRAKTRGTIRVKLLARMESTLEQIERGRAA